jgi:hypothetical protein
VLLPIYTHLLVQTHLIDAAIYLLVKLLLSRFAEWLERRIGSRVAGSGAEPPAGAPQTMA